MSDETYNGWKNYETWAVEMFLDGNYDGPFTYYETIERVKNALGYEAIANDECEDCEPRELAAAALETHKIVFSRWYA